MTAATVIAIFIIPMLFVVVERWSGAEKRRTERDTGSAALPVGTGS
jgi:hypothetical protein